MKIHHDSKFTILREATAGEWILEDACVKWARNIENTKRSVHTEMGCEFYFVEALWHAYKSRLWPKQTMKPRLFKAIETLQSYIQRACKERPLKPKNYDRNPANRYDSGLRRQSCQCVVPRRVVMLRQAGNLPGREPREAAAQHTLVPNNPHQSFARSARRRSPCDTRRLRRISLNARLFAWRRAHLSVPTERRAGKCQNEEAETGKMPVLWTYWGFRSMRFFENEIHVGWWESCAI